MKGIPFVVIMNTWRDLEFGIPYHCLFFYVRRTAFFTDFIWSYWIKTEPFWIFECTSDFIEVNERLLWVKFNLLLLFTLSTLFWASTWAWRYFFGFFIFKKLWVVLIFDSKFLVDSILNFICILDLFSSNQIDLEVVLL